MGIWEARFKEKQEKIANDFNSSIKVDSRMYEEDITGSIAHATMLNKIGILSDAELNNIIKTLQDILTELNDGTLNIDYTSEDIHMFIEAELTARIGDGGKKLHTARSRNDQVALDIRMYLKKEGKNILNLIVALEKVLLDKANKHIDTIMPGYTHMQIAQPITFAHHLLAYVQMFLRDADRLLDSLKRIDYMPLGAGALATTTYNIDRFLVKDLLGFKNVTRNSLDSVSDRDFIIELNSNLSILMVHLSRFCEELIIWQSQEFKFIEISDKYSTGSSIMPQKKNPDMAELIRGKAGRIIGNLNASLIMLKSLPLAYNKDMQEDKESIFDSIDNVKLCLEIFTKMIDTTKVNATNMLKKCEHGFINATDVADFLTKKGLAFREAYKIVGSMVSYCLDKEITLNQLSIEEFKDFHPYFDNDIYSAIDIKKCVEDRNVYGGPAKESVLKQISESLLDLKKIEDLI